MITIFISSFFIQLSKNERNVYFGLFSTCVFTLALSGDGEDKRMKCIIHTGKKK